MCPAQACLRPTVWNINGSIINWKYYRGIPQKPTHFFIQNKKRCRKFDSVFYSHGKSDGALDLIGAEASGTSVHMAGSSVNDSLNALDVGLPCTIGTSVGVRNLDTEGYALTTKITLSHSLHLPSFDYSTNYAPSQALRYDTKLSPKMQAFFSKIFDFLKIY